MEQTSTITNFINQYLDIDSIRDYCPNGLQVQGNTSKPNPLHIDDTFTLSLNLTNVDFVLDMLLNIDEGRFMNLSLGDLVPSDLSEDGLEQVVRRLARTLQQVRVNDLERPILL